MDRTPNIRMFCCGFLHIHGTSTDYPGLPIGDPCISWVIHGRSMDIHGLIHWVFHTQSMDIHENSRYFPHPRRCPLGIYIFLNVRIYVFLNMPECPWVYRDIGRMCEDIHGFLWMSINIRGYPWFPNPEGSRKTVNKPSISRGIKTVASQLVGDIWRRALSYEWYHSSPPFLQDAKLDA